jgi:hypothetical protein
VTGTCLACGWVPCGAMIRGGGAAATDSSMETSVILRQLRAAIRSLGPEPPIPYDMFERGFLEQEARSASALAAVYHKGQERAWDGRALLPELIEKHGGIRFEDGKFDAIARVLSILFWGELAAWKVSAELALHAVPMEAKMAATAQAHDEARHFFVLRDYLHHVGYEPGPLPPAAARMLAGVAGASHLSKKLVGMQLMVEPMALTLFHLIRTRAVEPVLCELLAYFARDEARHVALGVHYLPHVVRQLDRAQLLDLWQWQFRMFLVELKGLKEIERDVRALGFEPREVYRLAQAKQLAAVRLVQERLGGDIPIVEPFLWMLEFRAELDFGEAAEDERGIDRLRRAIRRAADATHDVDLGLAGDITEA